MASISGLRLAAVHSGATAATGFEAAEPWSGPAGTDGLARSTTSGAERSRHQCFMGFSFRGERFVGHYAPPEGPVKHDGAETPATIRCPAARPCGLPGRPAPFALVSSRGEGPLPGALPA